MNSIRFALMMFFACCVLSVPCPGGSDLHLCELEKVVADNTVPGDRFGSSVAVGKGALFVGASQEEVQYEGQGAVHVFSRSGDTWVEDQVILSPDPSENGLFGTCMDVDGDVLAVCATPWPGTRQVCVFEQGPSGWEYETTLTSGVEDDYFASRVSVSGDTIAVNAYRDDGASYSEGAVYVFVKNGGNWVQQAKLTASDAGSGDYFGIGVSVDGDRLVAGAASDDLPAGTDAGSAYVFLRTGTTWSEEQKLTASDGVTSDGFGAPVAIQGDTVLVGSTGDIHGPDEQGSVYVFQRSGSTWSEETKLETSDGVMYDILGPELALDGDEAAVTMWHQAPETNRSFAVYFYSRAGGTWDEVARLGRGISWNDNWPGTRVALGDGYLVASLSDPAAGWPGAVMVYAIGQGPCAPMLAVAPGPDSAAPNQVLGFDVWENPYPFTDFDAYPLYDGYGARVAAGDLDGDGRDEIVTGPGPGYYHPTTLRGFSRHSGLLAELDLTAYGVDRYGLNVACGDLDGDGYDEVVTGPGPGEVFGPHVRGWNVDNGDAAAMAGVNFFAYGTLKYGVNVACGDVDGDGMDEILTGAGPGAVFGPHVRGWNVDGGTATAIPGISYFAYGTLKWGVNVSAADIDGDGFDEIITGPGPGAVFGPHVRGWNYDGGVLASIPGVSYFAYGTNKYGVRVTGGDLDQDGYDEIVTTPGPGQPFGTHVRGWNYDGDALSAMASPNFFAFDSAIRYGADAAVVER